MIDGEIDTFIIFVPSLLKFDRVGMQGNNNNFWQYLMLKEGVEICLVLPGVGP